MELDNEVQLLPGPPGRVLVSADGTAVPPQRAREEHGVLPDIIFIREDGWALGAPQGLEKEAFALWPWKSFVRRPSYVVRPIREYEET